MTILACAMQGGLWNQDKLTCEFHFEFTDISFILQESVLDLANYYMYTLQSLKNSRHIMHEGRSDKIKTDTTMILDKNLMYLCKPCAHTNIRSKRQTVAIANICIREEIAYKLYYLYVSHLSILTFMAAIHNMHEWLHKIYASCASYCMYLCVYTLYTYAQQYT